MKTDNPERRQLNQSISIPPDIYKKVAAIAKEQERSFSFIVVKMVKEGLERREQDITPEEQQACK
jgi:predicted transcriptional regulator